MKSTALSVLLASLLAGFGSAVWALDISGASTIQPLVNKWVPLYNAQGGEAVKVAGGGSGTGVKNAQEGKSQIGMVSRALSAAEKASLKHTTVGLDALVMIVHQSNPLKALTKPQVVDLYSGKISNWKDLGGPDRPVVRISKEVGRSTLELFEGYTGLLSADRNKTDGKPLISKDSIVIGANIEALTLVGGLPGAVGYASFGDAQTLRAAGMPIQILDLDQVTPSLAAFSERRYPIVRELNLVYATESPAVKAFIDLALSAEGQREVQALGFVTVKN